MAKKRECRTWVVQVKREIVEEICVENCTREQAEADPWAFAVPHVEPVEIEGHTCKVISVEPNK